MRGLRVAGLTLAACLVGGCTAPEGEREALFDPDAAERLELRKDAEKASKRLASYKKADDDPAAEAQFYEAKDELTKMGAAIEPQLIEALNGDEDWAVRFGVINVLDSVGTKESIDSLIDALDDVHPQVAQKAMYTLRGLCDHQEVPEQGIRNGLPAIPRGEADDLDADYRAFIEWHRENGNLLHERWSTWWRENHGEIQLD